MIGILPDNIEQRFARLAPETPLVSTERLRDLLSGALHPETGAKDHTFAYSEQQLGVLLTLAERQQKAIEGLPSFSTPYWLSSGGGPGAGKTTDLFRSVARLYDVRLDKDEWSAPNVSSVTKEIFRKAPAFLVAPDRSGLVLIGEELGATFDKDFYLKWRWGSNFESNVGMARAFAGGKNIVHDTTLGSEYALHNLRHAKAAGRYVAVRATAAPLETRDAAVSVRNATFFQSLPVNLVNQDAQFGRNLPAIFQSADEVGIAWRNRADGTARLVVLVKENAVVSVKDRKGYEALTALYPASGEAFETRMTNARAGSEMPKIVTAQRKELQRSLRAPDSVL